MRDGVFAVFLNRGPSKMAGIDAAKMPLSAGMCAYMARRWWGAMYTFANNAAGVGRSAQDGAAKVIAMERPN